ncbi:Adenylate cyclase type 2 [Halotydeus destructor]|nr:Adenylate cyclase type 2 [Halotydeus destructor]
MINMLFNVIAIIIYLSNANRSGFPGPVVMRTAALIVYLAFFTLTWLDEHWLKPLASRIIAAVTVLIAMMFSEYGTALYMFVDTAEFYSLQRIRPTFYLIIANHVFLPFPSRIYGLVSTIIIVAIEILLSVNARIFISHCPMTSIYRYMAADLVFYTISAAIGFILTYLLEIANRRAFLDHRRCIHSKIKLEYEREQQEQLLNSCLPRHLSERVRKDMREVFTNIDNDEEAPPRPFNELYVEKFKNVSILYADIVNSMALASNLSPCELVETLNELFGRFDDTAEKNRCLRIKLLGDCYYCVSGLPNYDEDHAVNCLRMGLEMIRIIKSVRDSRQVDVDMRIGIHSGMVLSGMLGLHKWQYDIWSQDTMKASQMEHNGVAGFVHMTQTTFDLLPSEELKDLLVQAHNDVDGQITYLISKPPKMTHFRVDSSSPMAQRRGQAEKLKISMAQFRRSSSFDSAYYHRQSTVFAAQLKKYNEMLGKVNKVMEDDIDSMPLSKQSQWCEPRGIHPFCLNFIGDLTAIEHDGKEVPSTWHNEKKFASQPDPLFRYYIYCSTFLFLAMLLLKVIVPNMMSSVRLQWSLGATALILLSCLVSTYPKPERMSYPVRILIWFLISSSLILCASVDIVTETCAIGALQEKVAKCSYAWYYTFCMILAATSTTLFIRINLWFKFAFHVTILLMYIFLNKSECSALAVLDRSVEFKQNGHAPHVGYLYYICIVLFLMHVVDRQVEYILRLDYKWTTKLDEERQEVSVMGFINQILIENILPKHVAENYLHTSHSSGGLYHESYDSVAVVFASIPNYSDFYTETNINDDGLKCLLLLNEILCDFDKLLDQRSGRIEKIKTIGSTYMAAAGLQPGKSSNDSEERNENTTGNVVSLVEYAVDLMEKIQHINRDALQDFKLRIGIAVGPVIAGIVGAIKPQYDIWGDTVNVASRMESTGITGRIQVTEQVAEVLKNCGYTLECRGPVMVKGKGQLTTYLLKTAFDADEMEITRI